MRAVLILLVLLLCADCRPPEMERTAELNYPPPTWAEEAIWYQIFPERFYNGDSTNDPRREDMKGSYPGFVPEDWRTTPWGWEWHRLEPWLQNLEDFRDLSGNEVTGFDQKIQLRRYGGDLAGVFQKIDYLDSLGINAIYFNPLNDAPSLHKYDARHWRHIDRNFGPDPSGDAKLMAAEDPLNVATWQWTAADSLFLKLIEELHQRGIRLILDYSWNHTGTQFWAWQDLVQKQGESEFVDWYWTLNLDDPKTDTNEFEYRGWLGVPSLPEMRDTPYVDHRAEVKAFEGHISSTALRDHIYAISKRWLDPNGDGDPSDGVDGFRLDVAAEMPLGFWRDYRKEVKSINPEAYLIGEVWWQAWPDKLLNPKAFLEGDVFDAVMNYRWFRSTRAYIMAAPDSLSSQELIDSLKSYASSTDWAHQKAWMNMSASHDAPRLASAMFNRNAYKQGAKRMNFEYKIHKPDASARIRQKLFLLCQFTMPGAPQIFNGDEMGMWGADDPGNRKPLIWPEFEFEAERSYPIIKDLKYDLPQFDTALFSFYQELIQWRKSEETLVKGALSFPAEEQSLLIYDRVHEGDTLRCVLNASDFPRSYNQPKGELLYYYQANGQSFNAHQSKFPALSFALFRLQ